MRQYYVDIENKTAGPFTLDGVEKLFKTGIINGNSLYAIPDSSEWMPVSVLQNYYDWNSLVSENHKKKTVRIPTLPIIAAVSSGSVVSGCMLFAADKALGAVAESFAESAAEEAAGSFVSESLSMLFGV